jgi:ABC-type Mn2+/Zn2+ transport system permease subunit
VASGLAVGRVTRRRAIAADAAIGVITTASFAFGIALLGLYSRVKQSIEATVFGSVLGVSLTDMWTIIAIAIATTVAIIAFYRPLLFTTFDPDVADVSGVNTARIDALLMLLLTFAILASMKVLGVTLIAAALVIPPTVARLLTNSFKKMLIISTTLGASSGLVGMYLSYHLDISSGATIVLVNFALFALAYAYTAARPAKRRPGTAPATARARAGSPGPSSLPALQDARAVTTMQP